MNENLKKIINKLKEGGWYRVAFLGDSITSTEWVHPNWREIVEYVLKSELEEWVEKWEKPWWKMRFYNAGFNGATTRDMIGFIDEELEANMHPLFTILSISSNKVFF